FADTFATDGVLYLATGDQFVGHARLKQFVEGFRADPAFPGGQHFVSQILIEGTPERCAVSAYVMRALRMPNGTTSIYFLGQYDDVCVKQAGRWVVASRTVRRGPLTQGAPPQTGSAGP